MLYNSSISINKQEICLSKKRILFSIPFIDSVKENVFNQKHYCLPLGKVALICSLLWARYLLNKKNHLYKEVQDINFCIKQISPILYVV